MTNRMILPMRLATEWLRNAKTKEDKEKIYANVEAAQPALKLLINIILSRKAGMPLPKEDDYNSNSWAHLQAHRNGRIQECEWLLKLIQLNDRE